MSMQGDFAALVGPIVGGRVFGSMADAPPATPYITYFRVAVDEDQTLDTNGGTGNAFNTRLQCDVWAMTYPDAQTKAAAVKAALKGWSVENILLAEQDLYEPDTKLHRVMLDISAWHY